MVYDVVIIGAGLAGLTLAQQLWEKNPDISICILHDSKFPNEEVAFKIGEATIDIGGYYLRKIFGEEHVKKYFLKMAMRFIHTNGGSYKEMGVSNFPFQDSYQFPRGVLENDAYDLVKDKVNFLQNTRFIDVEDEGLLKKIHVIELGKKEKTISAKWLVDASGMKRILAKKYQLSQKHPLPNSSVWFRVDGAVLVDDIYLADTPDAFGGIDRSVSSLHIDGKGYWIWVLRLSDDKTSVGIVFSESIHNWDDLSTLEKTFKWLECHEPTFYSYLQQKRFPILDFKYLRKYVRVSSCCISKDRFALSGDAFAFIDPVYSGGVDTICICNTMITNIITQDMQDIDTSESIDFYNRMMSELLDLWSSVLHTMYERKDNWYYIFAKYMVDTAMYFGALCPFVMNDTLKDLNQTKEAWDICCQIFDIYKKVLSFLNKDNLTQHELPSHLNLTSYLFAAINCNVLSPQDDFNQLMFLLKDNLSIMEKIYEYVSTDKNLLDLYLPKTISDDSEHWRYSNFFNKENLT